MPKTLFLVLLFPLFCNAQSIQSLDIKNGFLQFKLGDSISNYRSIVHKPDKLSPNRYEVMTKAISLKRHIYKLTLIVENETISGIEVVMAGEQERFMDDAMKKAYGPYSYVENGADTVPGKHVSYTVWNGKRVSALAKKLTLTPNSINGRPINFDFETPLIRKTSDLKIDGVLRPDFPL
jgi:hypothetical protein